MTPEEKKSEAVRTQVIIQGVLLRRMRGQPPLTEAQLLQYEATLKGETLLKKE